MSSILSDDETEYEPKRKLTKLGNELNQLENATNDDLKYFPANQHDNDGQPLDLRPVNSWNLGLTDEQRTSPNPDYQLRRSIYSDIQTEASAPKVSKSTKICGKCVCYGGSVCPCV